jgi:DNA repair exonuclease SbcCD ATPase subunit
MNDENDTIIEEEESFEDENEELSVEETSDESPEKQNDTVEMDTAAGKKPWGLYITVGLLVVALLVLGYLLFIDKKTPSMEGSDQIRQMQQLAQNIRGLESDVKKKQDEIFSLMNQYKEKTGEPFVGVNALDLNEEEQKLLEQKIKDEKDVSTKSLLEEINEKSNEIKELQKKIKEIEALLPKPHVVTKGENHYQIAMDFLLNEKKVEKKRAMLLVERTALIDPMVPGFKVWNFYTGDAYGSSVTQGTAAISPNALIRKAKKKLVDARDEAISQRDKLSDEIKTLEEKRNQIIGQLDTLVKEKEGLINKVSDLNEQVNSLFYLLDVQRNLKKKGIIKGGFLKSPKLRKVAPEYFTTSIDLRAESEIAIAAQDMGLKKIKNVTLYPKFYKNGTDYKISIAPDKQTAAVTFLDIAKFKNERVVISVK